MVWKSLVLIAAVATLLLTGALALRAQGDAALTGMVSSSQEGEMEGVLVTARRDGANFDVTVVSDADGKYSFPKSHVAAGKYTIKIRAVGYDLASANTVEVADGETATLDLTLDAAEDLSTQLTSAEWLASIPGTDEQKSMVQRQILSCTYCHSMERIVKSRHDAERWVPVINRMQWYYPDGSMAGTEGRGRARREGTQAREAAEKNPSWGYSPGVQKTDLAAYLATVNMNGGRSLPTDLKTLPHPKGKATRVIITQYDLPRKDTVPHDSDVDSNGNVWYTDQSDYYVGRLDAKTGTFQEWPLPEANSHEFGGGSDVTVDRNGRVWFSVTSDKVCGNFGVPGRFDPETGQWTPLDLPDPFFSQFNALAPDGSIVQGGLKIDPDTMEVLDRFDYLSVPNAPPGRHNGYEPTMDSKGNWYITDFGGSYIVKIDAETKEVGWHKTPTAFSQPRRGKTDDQDRFWFAEYTGDRIAMFDGETDTITEWDTGIKWAAPYTASIPDAMGRVYSSSNTTDRVFQLDLETGEVVAFLMPTQDFDAKQLSIDPVSKKSVWMSNVRNARLIKIEPLD